VRRENHVICLILEHFLTRPRGGEDNKRFDTQQALRKERSSLMASTAGPTVANTKEHSGVAPLRAGQGHSFLLRRLHSLSGIVPVGAFLTEHFISNSFATNGPHAYADQVKFLTGLPFVHFLEFFGIFLPILFHALYGFYIWFRGDSNVTQYPWTGNWMYTAQRWTGAIAFAYIAFHTYEMRFTGVNIFENSGAAFGKVQQSLQNPWVASFYVVGIVASCWHFAYGIWLFAAKWGLTVGERSRRRFGVVCLGFGILLTSIGLFTMRAFFNPEWKDQPVTGSEMQVTRSHDATR
jgi:succinate dehydrogenase / fumarate reductase, cytochrome b subunit